MKIKGKGIVQLGLHKQAEFVHYVGAKRKHYSKDAPIDTPDFYLGIDCDPASIAYMIEEYGDISDANFLCSGIGEEGIKETVSWCAYKRPFLSKSVRLQDIFHQTQIDAISLLAMDIEGGEFDALLLYDWSILPDYLIMEAHSFKKPLNEAVTEIRSIVQKHGYKFIKGVSTNTNQKHPTMELEFKYG